MSKTIGVKKDPKITKLLKWAKQQSKQLDKAATAQSSTGISNIYYARKEWIDFELIPKLTAEEEGE